MGLIPVQLVASSNLIISLISVYKAIEMLQHLSLVVRKPVFEVSDQVPHKPGCTATEDGQRLEISDLGSRGIILSK